MARKGGFGPSTVAGGYGGQANGDRVATGGEMGKGIGVVGRGCIPGGIGAENCPPAVQGWPTTDPWAKIR